MTGKCHRFTYITLALYRRFFPPRLCAEPHLCLCQLDSEVSRATQKHIYRGVNPYLPEEIKRHHRYTYLGVTLLRGMDDS